MLGVARSTSGRAWRSRLACNRDALADCRTPRTAGDLGPRACGPAGQAVDDVEGFLNPTLRTIDAAAFRAARHGSRRAERLAQAIMRGEKIAIISDYDVDGVTSAALLTRFLRCRRVAMPKPIFLIASARDTGQAKQPFGTARRAGRHVASYPRLRCAGARPAGEGRRTRPRCRRRRSPPAWRKPSAGPCRDQSQPHG